jgi:hypothetical protein
MDIIEPATIGNGVIFISNNENFIERKPVKNEVVFRLKNNQVIFDLIIKNKKNLFDDETIANIVDFIDHEMKPYRPLPKGKRKETIEAYDSIFETLFEIFPHPYYV